MSGSGDTASAPASAGSVAAGGGAAHTFQQAGPTQFRFRLGLGDFALLHGDLSTVPGKKKALQLVDLYPEPIEAAHQNDATDVYTAALEYAHHCLGADLSGLTQALAQLVQEAPASGDSELVNRVLTDLTHDAWLILPGTYTFTDDDMLGTEGGSLHERRREREDAFYAGNDALGKFPLTVHVEMQRDGNWVAAARTQVQIQLVPPQPGATKDQMLDAAVALLPTTVEPPRQHWHRVPAHSSWYTAQDGARGYLRRALDDHFQATDPQGVNVREQRGGLRGHALLNGLFRQVPAGPAGSPAPTALSAGRANAVQATTDDQGDVRFLFCPSRVTGDRYKLRIFVDPWDGNACDGTEARHPRIESGVFTVYKSVRFAGVTQKPVPARLTDWYSSAAPTLGNIDYSTFNNRLRKARLLAQHDGFTPQTWDEAGYLAALDFVRAHIRDYLSGKKYDMDALLPAQLWFVADQTVTWNSFPMNGGTVTLRGHNAHAHQVIDVRGTNAAGANVSEQITLNGTHDVTGTTQWRSIASMMEHQANPVRFTVIRAGGNVEVHDSLSVGSGRVTVKSTDAGDTMGLELFGTNGGAPAREAVRLNGTHAVTTVRTFDTLCGARVRAKDDGTGHGGTIQIALHGTPGWPIAELAPGSDAVNVRSASAFQSPHTFMMMNPRDYNALRRHQIPAPSGGGTEQSSSMRSGSNGWWDYSDAITACANALAFYLTKNATGIAITRALSGDPISVWGWLSQPYRLNPGHDGLPALPSDWLDPTTSGVATRFRAAHVWYPEQIYNNGRFPYDLTSNVLHEAGHVQFLRHQWTNVDDAHQREVRQQGNGDGFPPDHDYHDVCVMSYHHCDGDYCGRCLLRLAGLQINQIPANH